MTTTFSITETISLPQLQVSLSQSEAPDHDSQSPNTLTQEAAEPNLSHEVPALTSTDGTAVNEFRMSRSKGAVIIGTLSGVNFLNSMGSGILIAALPRMAKDVGLPDALLLWPAAVYSLAAGCLLLLFSAAADAVGVKLMWLTGSFLYMIFTLALGLSTTGIQVIMFRVCLGIFISMCLPTAVSLITNTFPRGTWRNVAFAMNGMAAPLGYAVGLVLGGIFTDTIGWRWAYYTMALINFCISVQAIWSLPAIHHQSDKKWMRRLLEDVDWVGALILSIAFGILLYVLATTTSSYKRIDEPQNISLLLVSVLLLGSFPFWMRHRTRRERPALIPNRIWRNAAFTAVCFSVFLSWASLTCLEYFITLYFQQVQGLSALQSSIRFLPHVILGASVNVATAYLVSRVKIQKLAMISGIITMITPILMATVTVDENYWLAPFWALLLSPTSADVLFTVSNLVISDAFPPELQSFAGGVFNEMSQIGNSVGLAVTAAIAASVTDHQPEESHQEALMDGYRAAFWTIFAATATVIVVVLFGLRRGGTVGKKRD